MFAMLLYDPYVGVNICNGPTSNDALHLRYDDLEISNL
jgi:hypothetical protein